jgi:hypothetical protein
MRGRSRGQRLAKPARARRWRRLRCRSDGASRLRAALLAVVFVLGLVHVGVHEWSHDKAGHFAAGNDLCVLSKLPGDGPAIAPAVLPATCYTESFRFVSVEALPRFSAAVGFRPRDPPPV